MRTLWGAAWTSLACLASSSSSGFLRSAIIYLDFVTQRLRQKSLKEALVEAAYLRFRPILMTTLTVFVISLPLLFGRGAGAEFGQGLGVVMFGGILVSALLTLFVVPAAFYLFERGRPLEESPAALREVP